ncbi:hypothetical protein GO986_16175 [Deinococcus sp. HMF7620]|uniref:Uncharacterized protein n=1 Tax=Deinococcus arboris TaxID=2682977 RepID=A0A7C9MAC3_9DEIO|nr:hypothetical protein [Deinococcus arboris]MVN88283.1 hypothetical protein [Deinococcus arboris]
MAKADTIRDIEAANGQKVPDTLNQKQLDELLALAKRDGAEQRDAFDGKLNEFQGKGSGKAAPKEKTVTVRVNDAIAAYGGEFTDPGTREVIGKEPTEVPLSPFVREKLRSEELIEAD